MADVFGIEPDHAGLERVRHAERAAHIAGPDVTGEAILHAIGNSDGVALVPEGNDGQERSEYFFLGYAHPGMRAGDKCRLHIMPAAGAVMRLATDRNRR